MALTVPPEIEEALWDGVAEVVPAAALAPSSLHEAIRERSERYTSARERLGERLDPRRRARDLAARACFFTVADTAKVLVPLRELDYAGCAPARRPWRMLDVGAGCGAMTWGLVAHLGASRIEVTAVDGDGEALRVFLAVARRLGVAARAIPLGLAGELPPGPFDLVVAGSVLNELPAGARAPLVRSLLRRLAPDGAVILVEPALRDTARDLHALRDALLAAGGVQVLAPCTRTATPCTALASPRDWCHEDRAFAPPPRLARLIAATGLRGHGVKMAYLVLRGAGAQGPPLVVAPPGTQAWRVVSDPLDGKGTVERVVCGEDGRLRLRLLRRQRGVPLTFLDRSRRGDVLLVSEGGEVAGLSAPGEERPDTATQGRGDPHGLDDVDGPDEVGDEVDDDVDGLHDGPPHAVLPGRDDPPCG